MDKAISPSLADAVIQMGKICGLRGWLPATSGNFSVRSDADHMVITASGGDKTHLTQDDLIKLAINTPDHPRASAEAPLHAAIYRARPDAGAIAHVHAQSAVLASLVFQADGAVVLHGLELQKALSGIKTHETTIRIPIFANDQDMVALGDRAFTVLDGADRTYGLLLAGHGLYAFGPDANAALRHVEALDALFRTQLALKGIPV